MVLCFIFVVAENVTLTVCVVDRVRLDMPVQLGCHPKICFFLCGFM